MLFDLSLDAAERKNLISDPDYAPVLLELRGKLQQFMEDTDDFAETGNLPKVEGMIMNTVTCIDPDSNNPADYEK